jgi:hypothetical protein
VQRAYSPWAACCLRRAERTPLGVAGQTDGAMRLRDQHIGPALKLLTILVALFGPVLELGAQGFNVPNRVLYNLYSAQEIDVIYSPTNARYTGFRFEARGTIPPSPYPNSFLFDVMVDIGVRVFLVSSNDPVSLQPIQAGAYTELFSPNTYVFNNGVPFYVGLFTGNMANPPPDGIYTDPPFGWAELVNNRGTMQLLGGVMEYGGAGIFAGTQNIIPTPEPGAGALFGLAVLLFLRYGPRPESAQVQRRHRAAPRRITWLRR